MKNLIEHKNIFTDDEKELLTLFRKLSWRNQIKVLGYAEYFIEKEIEDLEIQKRQNIFCSKS